MKARLLLIIAASALCVNAKAQCVPDTLTIGTQDTVSMGLSMTPFPTSVGRGARVQYFYPCQLLQDAGVCPNTPITGIAFNVIDNDLPGTLITLRVRCKNTVASDCNYDDVGNLTVEDQWETHIDSGLMVIPFTTSPYLWTGCPFNLQLDIASLRNDVPGISPSVVIDTTTNVPTGEYGYDDGSGSIAGWDPTFEILPTVTFGCMHYRPVIGLFMGIPLGNPTIWLNEAKPAIFPNPATDHISIKSGSLQPGKSEVRIFDAMGRMIQSRSISSEPTVSDLTIPLEDLAPGIYQVVQVIGDGLRRNIGPLVVQ